jgi:hypothetical protein
MKNKIKFYQTAVEVYKKGENIAQALLKAGANKSDIIEIAYELQSGSYTSAFYKSEFGAIRNKALHVIIEKYCRLDEVSSVGVFGVGEAVNWIGFNGCIDNFYGVELSYSRLKYADNNLSKLKGIGHRTLIKGDASEVIFNDNSFDLSITLHSIEPNGNEQGTQMLHNVVNSSSKYVLLFEPDYLTAPESMKVRMKSHDYVCNISEELEKIDSIRIVDKFNLDIQGNSDNLTTCWMIEKIDKNNSLKVKTICPFSYDELIDYENTKYSKMSGLAYPIINNFVFLNKNDAIFVGRHEEPR